MDSLQGKRVVITGPTSGVGKEIAVGLAALGADLTLACRDVEKGEQVASEITRQNGSSDVDVMQIDTSSQASIRAFAREFRRKYDRLDVLINNAAMNRGTLPKVDSVDGIELTFATNVLGYFLLTNELLDLLKASAPARLINVASLLCQRPRPGRSGFRAPSVREFQSLRPVQSLRPPVDLGLRAPTKWQRRDRQRHDARPDHRDGTLPQRPGGFEAAPERILRRAHQRPGRGHRHLAGQRARTGRRERQVLRRARRAGMRVSE